MIAGIATGKLPDTIRDRSIVIAIDRKKKSERVQRLRRRRVQTEIDALRSGARAWAAEHEAVLYDYEVETLERLSDRLEEAWEPLLAIADLAGGDWPTSARAAAERLSGVVEDEDGDAAHVLLVALRELFEDREVVTSAAMRKALNDDESLPFGGWNDGKGITARQLANLLKRYRIKPHVIRLDDGSTPRGYRREWFKDAWERYLAATSATTAAQSQKAAPGDPQQDPSCCGSETGANPHSSADVADVADADRPTGTEGDFGPFTEEDLDRADRLFEDHGGGAS